MVHNSTAEQPMGSTLVGQLYTTGEVARLFRVSQRTVQVWIRSGELPAMRYGQILRVREADLAAFGEVLNQRPPAASADTTPVPTPAQASQTDD
jgi:excisionase family DNA binding protein